MEYRVTTFREAGLEAKWSRYRTGRPIIVVRDPNSKLRHQREKWWTVDGPMFKTMEQEGVKEGFDQHTLLGDVFYLPV